MSAQRRRWRSWLKWLYPGMGVKRWALLTAVAMLLIILGIVLLLGRDLVRLFYNTITPTPALALAVGVSLLALGIAGAAVGVHRFLRSIIQGVAPTAVGQTAEVLYSKRLLARGPVVVAFGGGTGLSTLLRGLKEFTSNITAVVAVMDDGGSSGRLRRELDILPPGDIRNCLIALADDESRIAQLFQHRFRGGSLNGHSLGNLVIAGLKERLGRFDLAIEELSHILNIRGQVLPATLERVDLVAEMADGGFVRGEQEIARDPRKIKRMLLSKQPVEPYKPVLEEIARAEAIVLGPGSLFTSIIPNLLVSGIAQAIARSPAKKFFVVNLMTQPGETDGFTARDHLRALSDYFDITKLDYVVVNTQPVPAELAEQYRREGSIPVLDDLEGNNPFQVIREELLDIVELEGKPTIKHHPRRLARAIIARVKPELLVKREKAIKVERSRS